MQDLCPLCLKNDLKKKIRLFQINLQEAVWMCEEETCIWPFGCEDFVYCPRMVGKIWTCYWDNNKPSRAKENTISAIKEPLHSVPVTPITDTSKDCIISTLDTNDDINIIGSKSNISLNDNNLQLGSDNIKNKNIVTQHVKPLTVNHVKKEFNASFRDVGNMNNVTEVTKIITIENKDIDVSTVKANNKNFTYQNQNKNDLNIVAHINDREHNLLLPLNDTIQHINHLSKYKELQALEPSKNNQLSNLNITMMEIDGLPPITVTFETPTSTTIPESLTCNIQQNVSKNNIVEHTTYNDIKPNTLGIKNTSVRRNITSGKQYEKFSFSTIKKKIETNKSTDISSNSNSLSSKLDFNIQGIENDSVNNVMKKGTKNVYDSQSIGSYNRECKPLTLIKDEIDVCMPNQVNDSGSDLLSQKDNFLKEEVISHTAVNIDNVLQDFLSNDCVSENINDEWINSLLN